MAPRKKKGENDDPADAAVPTGGRRSAKGAPVNRTALMGLLRDTAVKAFGERAVPDAETFFDSVYGIPLTGNLPLQYIMGLDVIPMERAVYLVGSYGSMKSSMAWYFAKCFIDAGGIVIWVDSEHKSNPFLIKALLQVDNETFGAAVLPNKVYSLEEMLTNLNKHAAWYAANVPTCDVPVMLLVDSLAAVTSEKAVKATEAGRLATSEGFGAAHNARDITEEMRVFVPKHLANLPMTLLCTNHQKPTMDQTMPGMPAKKAEPGGSGKDFAATTIIEMSAGKDLSNKVEEKTLVYMKTKKNAMSRNGKKIAVAMVSVPGFSYFDWDTALIDLLTGDDCPIAKDQLNEVVKLNRANASKCSCSTLGIVDALPRDVGAAIHNNPEIYAKLQGLLRVQKSRFFGAPESNAS